MLTLSSEDAAILRACLTRSTCAHFDQDRVADLVNRGLLMAGAAAYVPRKSYETTRAGREKLGEP